MSPFLEGEAVQDWPALIGVPVADAIAAILRERLGVDIELQPEGAQIGEVYRPNRVVIYHAGGVVTTLPSVG